MMIDLNGPDVEAADEVKALVLEYVNAWINHMKWMPFRKCRCNPTEQECKEQKVSRDLRMWFSMIS